MILSALRSTINRLAPKQTTAWLPVLAAGIIVTGIYAATLMTAICGCNHEYCTDVGEFQVALPTWGTVHYTGYPLYMLLGSPFVNLLRVIGIQPALGASLYSLFWEVLAIIGVVLLAHRLGKNAWLACGIGLVFALLEPVWIHGVLAEVYSLSNALRIALLLLAFRLRENWSDGGGWLLALLGGTGVAHHRLVLLVLVPIGIYLFPSARRSRSLPRWLLVAGLCFAAGFLPYVDIPLRISLGSNWNYDQANTWQGFWRIFWGDEMAGLQRPELALPALASAAQDISRVLTSVLTLPGLILVSTAAVRAVWVRRTRGPAWLAMGVTGSFLLFVLFFRNAVLIQASLMGAIMGMFLLLAIGIGSTRANWQSAAGVLCFGWAAWLAASNWPFITSLTHDQGGVTYTATVEKLEAPADSVVMSPWGADYFALAYAQRVQGRMPQLRIVDHRADFRELAARPPHRVYTHSKTLFLFGPDWWGERLGTPLRIASAGPEMLMLTARPLEPAGDSGVALGDGVVLDHWVINRSNPVGLRVTLYWTATRTPAGDYSTFVHVSNKERISHPDDLVAQSDYRAPVYGWYPTWQWVPGEIIREDHNLQMPADRHLRTIIAGMYWQDANGTFMELGQVSLRMENGQWLEAHPARP